MKKLLLLIIIPFLGCEQTKKVLMSDLNFESHIAYYNDNVFNGIGFIPSDNTSVSCDKEYVFSEGIIKSENGCYKGVIPYDLTGKMITYHKVWNHNNYEVNYQQHYNNGQLKAEITSYDCSISNNHHYPTMAHCSGRATHNAWYENGEKWYQFSNPEQVDLRDGLWKSWWDNGKLAMEILFENGKPTGLWSFYDINGVERIKIDLNQPTFTLTDKNPFKYWNCFDDKGEKIDCLMFKNEQPIGGPMYAEFEQAILSTYDEYGEIIGEREIWELKRSSKWIKIMGFWDLFPFK